MWQLSMSNGLLSSTSLDASMTFQYPIEIAKDLVVVSGQFPRQSMEVHGIGLVSSLSQLGITSSNIDIGCEALRHHLHTH